MSDGGALLVILAVLYFLPCLLAGVRGRRNTIAIFALNLFLGWTLLGWVMALVWALSAQDKGTVVTNHVVVGQPGTPKGKPEKQKRCIACAEWIMRDAIKCKHCGEMQMKQVTPVAPPVLAVQPAASAARPEESQSISIANWTSKRPSARDTGIDWNKVHHSDRNTGRQ